MINNFNKDNSSNTYINNPLCIFYDGFQPFDIKPTPNNTPQITVVIQSLSQLDEIYNNLK